METPAEFGERVALRLKTARETGQFLNRTQTGGAVAAKMRAEAEILQLECEARDNFLDRMTDEQREEYFAGLSAVYCLGCGRKTEGKRCHCTNDE